MTSPVPSTARRGALLVVPNTLDFGTAGEPAPLDDLLPIGVIRIAARLRHWVCENAKTTRAFLKRVDAVSPLGCALQGLAIVELPRPRKGAKDGGANDPSALLAPALAGHELGLLSEAGLPALADPGATLVAAAHAAGLPVSVLPGASSIAMALAASGLNGQSFAFVGYVPIDAEARRDRIRSLEAHSRRDGQTQVLIETPYRNAALLDSLLAHLDPRTMLAVGAALSLPGAFTRTDSVAGWRRRPAPLDPDIPAVFSFLAQ